MMQTVAAAATLLPVSISGGTSSRWRGDGTPILSSRRRDQMNLSKFSVPTERSGVRSQTFGRLRKLEAEFSPNSSENFENIEQAVAKDHLLDVGSLVQGEVGRMALVASLLLGVGVASLVATGDADAATGHLRDGLHSSLDVDMRALAMGPEGPLLEEFWDNMRRYGLYFLTVASGGLYNLVKPAVDALRNPVTAVLVVIVTTGTIYLVGLTVSAMLGINEYQYEYAP